MALDKRIRDDLLCGLLSPPVSDRDLAPPLIQPQALGSSLDPIRARAPKSTRPILLAGADYPKRKNIVPRATRGTGFDAERRLRVR